jgi:hypothetical protein
LTRTSTTALIGSGCEIIIGPISPASLAGTIQTLVPTNSFVNLRHRVDRRWTAVEAPH